MVIQSMHVEAVSCRFEAPEERIGGGTERVRRTSVSVSVADLSEPGLRVPPPTMEHRCKLHDDKFSDFKLRWMHTTEVSLMAVEASVKGSKRLNQQVAS